MARAPSRRFTEATLSRRHGQRKPAEKTLVVCEGKTEQHLLDGLRIYFRLPSVSIEIIGQAGVPETVVKRAKQQRCKYDIVWVVFDRDEHPNWSNAIVEARDNGLCLADSNPCIELWGILLHRDPGSCQTRMEAQAAFRKVHPKYNHQKHPYFDIKTTIANLDAAHGRAEKLLAALAKHGEAPHGCPSTRFHKLVEDLRRLAAPLSSGPIEKRAVAPSPRGAAR